VRKTYVGVDVDVSFDPEVCVHSNNCVRGQPAVFDTSRWMTSIIPRESGGLYIWQLARIT
jgi:uncharacterized Fe-S cluster protein YjdI